MTFASDCERMAKKMGLDNVRNAGNYLGNQFAQFADTISPTEIEDFFHPINRNVWIKEFGLYLQRKVDGRS